MVPAIPEPAPALADATAGEGEAIATRMGRFSRLTRPWNGLGCRCWRCRAALPPAGCLLGLQIVGRPLDEAHRAAGRTRVRARDGLAPPSAAAGLTRPALSRPGCRRGDRRRGERSGSPRAARAPRRRSPPARAGDGFRVEALHHHHPARGVSGWSRELLLRRPPPSFRRRPPRCPPVTPGRPTRSQASAVA